MNIKETIAKYLATTTGKAVLGGVVFVTAVAGIAGTALVVNLASRNNEDRQAEAEVTPTATATPTPIIEVTPTEEPTPTPTNTLAPTPTSKPAPTPTPKPVSSIKSFSYNGTYASVSLSYDSAVLGNASGMEQLVGDTEKLTQVVFTKNSQYRLVIGFTGGGGHGGTLAKSSSVTAADGQVYSLATYLQTNGTYILGGGKSLPPGSGNYGISFRVGNISATDVDALYTAVSNMFKSSKITVK